MTTASLPAVGTGSATIGQWTLHRQGSEEATPSMFDDAGTNLIHSLLSVTLRASTPNWDGYGAEPISFKTFAMGQTFCELLPGTLPKPEVTANPDGDLEFEWYFAQRRVLTVAVNETGRINYAWIMGMDRHYGSKYLVDRFPDEIVTALRRLRLPGDTPVR